MYTKPPLYAAAVGEAILKHTSNGTVYDAVVISTIFTKFTGLFD